MSRASIGVFLLLAVAPGNARLEAQPAGTPVLISSDEECRVSVDGEEVGTVLAGGLKKISLAPGEHLVSAVCSGTRKWKETVTVGREQKVVTIPAGSGAASAAAPQATAPPPPEVGTGCILLFDPNRDVAAGRWRAGAVIRDTPCDKAQIRAGTVALSLGRKKAKDFTTDDTQEFQSGGPIGSTVELEVLDRDGEVRKVTLTRAAMPAEGTVDVIQLDGQTVRSATFGGERSLQDALRAAVVVEPPPAVPPSPGTAPTAAKTCTGVPVACGLRNPVTCALGAGCSARGNCTGTGQTCAGKSQFTCATTPGCFWMAGTKTCTGMGQTCFGKTSAVACTAVAGCTWTALCLGIPTPCASLSEALCALQPGCSWR